MASNRPFERTAGSHSLAAATQRQRYPQLRDRNRIGLDCSSYSAIDAERRKAWPL